jgi:hypothetical protein
MDTSGDGMATVFRSASFTGEIEAETIRGMLDTNGIKAFVTAMDVLPEAYALPAKEVLVLVFPEQKELAERLIAEALAAGPSAAEEAEAATEGRLRPDV